MVIKVTDGNTLKNYSSVQDTYTIWSTLNDNTSCEGDLAYFSADYMFTVKNVKACTHVDLHDLNFVEMSLNWHE